MRGGRRVAWCVGIRVVLKPGSHSPRAQGARLATPRLRSRGSRSGRGGSTNNNRNEQKSAPRCQWQRGAPVFYQKPVHMIKTRKNWRRGRDSNPRSRFRLSRSPSVPNQPLWHLSALGGFDHSGQPATARANEIVYTTVIVHTATITYINETVYTKTGGERGIRTPETLAGLPAFEAGPFGHSGISPRIHRPRRVLETGF